MNTTNPGIKNQRAPRDFGRLASDEARRDFWRLISRSGKWWYTGAAKDAQRGWPQIFDRDKWRCVYCSSDLVGSMDNFAASTEEHLVPQSLMQANGQPVNFENNMAACCRTCNAFKSDFVPPANSPCWKNRKAYIKECQKFIAAMRLERFNLYAEHIKAALTKRAQ